MSEHVGVHIHAPHEENVHEAAEHGDSLASRVALTTAILATLGALFGYAAAQFSTDSLMLKNDAIARLTESSDQWAYYQAKNQREFLSKAFAATLPAGPVKDDFVKQGDVYAKQKGEIAKKAQELSDESKKLDAESRAKIVPHERIGLGVTLMQVAVAMASITVLARKAWLFVGALLFSAAGIGVAAWGYFSV
ncbi:MAG: DUF4337 domain-containing protein [Hyphomicrobiales bacterium]|nr:DUF4337 family protein [Hyphomicrobiales bacterium]MDE2018172.1 DUF4337 domain-containing protein [Hyphomicrobiales bacterium]